MTQTTFISNSKQLCRKMQSENMSKKMIQVIQDCIHGTIELHPAVKLIMDTPHFQRLKHIKQLSGCHFVYPTATHSRFEHCLGVSHLAKMLAQKFKDEMKTGAAVTEKDVNCVMLAGLCHDLGHGPYSHLWEAFITRDDNQDTIEKYKHETTTIALLEDLLDANNKLIRETLRAKFGIDETDITFIKEMIGGEPYDEKTKRFGFKSKADGTNSEPWEFKGRGEEKQFLYEIVANKINDIDVDKIDYLMRDDHQLKIGHAFDYDHCLKFCRVEIEPKSKRPRICFRDKEEKNIREIDKDRNRMHRIVYKHKKVTCVEQMLLDAWKLADKHVKIRIKGGELIPLSKAHEHMEAFIQLTDGFVDFKILELDTEEIGDIREKQDLLQAQELLRRIQRRDLYKIVKTVKGDEISLKDEELLQSYNNSEGRQYAVKRTKIESSVKMDQVCFWKYADRENSKERDDIEVFHLERDMVAPSPVQHVVFIYDKGSKEAHNC